MHINVDASKWLTGIFNKGYDTIPQQVKMTLLILLKYDPITENASTLF
jgi:hypothetical protein